MHLPRPSVLPPRPRQHIRGPLPTAAAEPRRVRRRSNRSALTDEPLRTDLCGRGLRLGLVALLLVGLADVGRSLWQEDATLQADRLQASARQTASHRVSQPWWSALFDPAPRHAAPAQASAPSLWDQKPAAGALVPVAHPAEANAPGPVVPRSRKDEYAAPARVAAVSLSRPDAGTFSLGVPAPAAPVTFNRQTPVHSTTGSSGPANPGVSAPRKALVSAPVAAAAGAKPQAAAAQDLYVDKFDPGEPNEYYAGSSYSVPAGSTTYSNAYVGFNSMGTVTQAGSSLTVSNTVHLGDNAGSNGMYNLSGTGRLSTGTTVVGNGGSGVFIQSGGTHTVGGVLYVGATGGTGTYNLTAGTVASNESQVGNGAAGTFTQSGGTHSVTTSLELGLNGGSGTYNLSGGSLASANYLYVGFSGSGGTVGTGVYNQSGGTAETGTVYLGNGVGTTGTYNLSGGTLTASGVYSGSGTGTFNFNGGTLQASASDNPGAASGATTFFSGLTTAQVRDGGAVIDTNGFNATVSQPLLHSTISGDNATDGGLTKLGLGTLTLSGESSYNGPTMVNAGTLAVNGHLDGPGLLTVLTGATLAGTGSVSGNVTVQSGGTLTAGQASAGTLMLGGNLTLTGTATAAFTLGGTTAGSGYTQLYVGGALTLGGSTLNVSLANGFTLALNETFFLIDRTGTDLSQIGTFGNAPGGIYTDAAGDTFLVNYLAVDPANGDLLPNDVSLTVLSVVPEPGTWTMLFIGVGLLGVALRRHVRRA